MDTATLQLAINAVIDVIWPFLPPVVLDQLSYV